MAIVALVVSLFAFVPGPASPAEAATCSGLAQVHKPSFDNAARKTWASAAVRRCSNARKACVYLHHGRAVGLDFQWLPWASKCVDLSYNVLVRPTTDKKRCDPGYYYSELYIYDASGRLIDTSTSQIYDGTPCAT